MLTTAEIIGLAKVVVDTAKLVHDASRRNAPATMSTTLETAPDALGHHLKHVENWSAQITIKSGTRQFELSKCFVKLRLAEGCSRAGPRGGQISVIDPETMLSPGQHAVVFGEPGAGKTTLLKYLCQLLLKHEPTHSRDSFQYPVLVSLRMIQDNETLNEMLLRYLGVSLISVDCDSPEKQRLLAAHQERVLATILNQSEALVLLDGIDETSAAKRATLVEEISRLASLLEDAMIVATCRFGAMPETIENVRSYAVEPLQPEDVEVFAEHWFDDEALAGAFLHALSATTYEGLARTPLHLANLCLIYEARKRLPESSIRIYETIVNLRLEQWDRERGIVRESEYASFGPDEKRRFLAALSFQLASDGVRAQQPPDQNDQYSDDTNGVNPSGLGVQFTRRQLSIAYRKLVTSPGNTFNLEHEREDHVLTEIESHTGLVLQIDDDLYEFYHLTIFEYLCAEFLSRSQLDVYDMSTIAKIPEATAVCTALVASADDYLITLAVRILYSQKELSHTFGESWIDVDFWRRFLARIRSDRIRLPPTIKTGCAILIAASYAWRIIEESIPTLSHADGYESLTSDICFIVHERRLEKSVSSAIQLYNYQDVRTRYAVLKAKSTTKSGSLTLPRLIIVSKALFDLAFRGTAK